MWLEIHPRTSPGYECWGVSMGSYCLFAGWIVSVYHELIHGQSWISTYFAHTWILTQLPELSSLFTPPWLLHPGSAWWRVPRFQENRAELALESFSPGHSWSSSASRLYVAIVPKLLVQIGLQPFTVGVEFHNQARNSTAWKRKMSILGSDISVTSVTSQEKTLCFLLIPPILIKTNKKKHLQVNYLLLKYCSARLLEYVPIT